MKKYIVFFALAMQAMATQAQSTYNTKPYLTRSLAANAISSVDVKTSGGSISVTGGNSSEARVDVFVTGNNGKQPSKTELDQRLKDDYELTINVNNNKLSVMAKQKTSNMNWKRSLSISFVVYTAANVSTQLKTSGGSISLANITGNQNFSTSGGSLTVDGVGGNIKGRTSGGSISVKNSTDNIDLSTSGGSITASTCKGAINLRTSGGSLTLDNLDGAVSATTSGGSITTNSIKGELKSSTSGGSIRMKNMMCSLESSTSGGTINVEVKQLGKYLSLRNSSGNINIVLPAQKGMDLDLSAMKINSGTLKNFNGKVSTDEISGSLNGGGVPVKINAGSGIIDLVIGN